MTEHFYGVAENGFKDKIIYAGEDWREYETMQFPPLLMTNTDNEYVEANWKNLLKKRKNSSEEQRELDKIVCIIMNSLNNTEETLEKLLQQTQFESSIKLLQSLKKTISK